MSIILVGIKWQWFGYLYKMENKHTLYRGKDCMKKFCEFLREDAKNIINFKKKPLLTLTKEELKWNQESKVCCIRGKRFIKSLRVTKTTEKLQLYRPLQLCI